jgi:hypothetical protein
VLTRDCNYGNCIAVSRPDRITPGTLWIGNSNVNIEVYPTTQLLHGVSRISINHEGTRENNYGNCFTASRHDRINPDTHWIGGSNDKIGVYPTTQLLSGVARVSIKMKELETFIMEIVTRFHDLTALPPVLIG